ncbi:uncharacterized protein LOC131853326 [Achroia grisella]|uniref:uncharacterized protein LOC131853326 n=1 Tax=Achroia grisella TaxID=688607 RepID=UPI0027D2B1CB|nr:uncharacterized protein LOC131853326 [Achroia grisella]
MKLIILALVTMIALGSALPRVDLYKLVISNDIDDTNVNDEYDLDNTAAVSPNLYIPMELRGCNNVGCDNICKVLGFKHGKCVSANTCRCYN